MNKIFIFTDYNYKSKNGGGITTAIRNLMLNLNTKFHFLNIYNFENSNINISEIVLLKPNLFYLSRLYKLDKTYRPNCFYINGLFSFSSSIMPYFYGVFFKRKIILSPRGMLKNSALKNNYFLKIIILKIYKLFLNKNVIFHATNQIEENEIKNIFSDKYNINIISDIPPELVLNKTIQIKKEKNEINILYLARIDSLKNLKYALNIISKASMSINHNYKINFNIAGEIADKNYWLESKLLINSINTNKNIEIKYLGKLNKIEIDNLFNFTHLLFLPTKGENFGYSIFEALSNSIPVLISNKTPFQSLEKIGFGFDIPLENDKIFIDKLIYYISLNDSQYNQVRNNIFENYNSFAKTDLIIQQYTQFLN